MTMWQARYVPNCLPSTEKRLQERCLLEAGGFSSGQEGKTISATVRWIDNHTRARLQSAKIYRDMIGQSNF